MTQWNSEGIVDAVLPARDAERSAFVFERERALPTHTAEAPIGVFDSGAGGLTILTMLRQEMPHENYIYIGDTAHVPYGQRSDDVFTTDAQLTASWSAYEVGLSSTNLFNARRPPSVNRRAMLGAMVFCRLVSATRGTFTGYSHVA